MPLYAFDEALIAGTAYGVIGTDEAGRGPLAGPVVAAAVKLHRDTPIKGVNDSKLLSDKKRQQLYKEITEKAISWGVAYAEPQEIDRINILRASLLAMKRAVDMISQPWSLVLVDGIHHIGDISQTCQRTVIKGDSKSASIAAASILAKVSRDFLMKKYHEQYPQYGFDRHKGYPTKEHREALIKFGMCPIHRRSFCETVMSQIELELQ